MEQLQSFLSKKQELKIIITVSMCYDFDSDKNFKHDRREKL